MADRGGAGDAGGGSAGAGAGDAGTARVDKVMRGVYAAILALEGLTALLLPRTLAQTGSGLTGLSLTLTLVLAGVLFVAAGMQRRPWGFAAGSVLQVVFLATGFLTPAMFFLGLVFAGVWIAAIRLRGTLLEYAGRAA